MKSYQNATVIKTESFFVVMSQIQNRKQRKKNEKKSVQNFWRTFDRSS